MKKLLVTVVFLLAMADGVFAQSAPIPPLFWVGGDFGWNGTSFGGGANIDTGFLVAKDLYFDLVESFFLAGTTSLQFGAGVRYFPFGIGKGLVAGLNLGGGDVQTRGVDDWCIGSSGMIGYDFGWIVLGTKISIYFTSPFQTTYGLFVELT